jgi:hypothetical protein
VTGFITVLALLCLCLPVAGVEAGGSWHGEYYANPDLWGAPALTRYDQSLHFDWGLGSPGAGIPKDDFSARWTRSEWFTGGKYRFSYSSDDGVRIWVGDVLVVDDWRARQAGWSSVDRHIPTGSHEVRVEYFEHRGAALLQVNWGRVSDSTVWRAEYFDNMGLAGSPVLVRDDSAIDFDWGKGSPDGVVPKNKFSVRWTRTIDFDAGTYRFYAGCDDGVRVFVDGSLIVAAWYEQELPNTRSGDIVLSAGPHTVIVEYYESKGAASAHVWWKLVNSLTGWEGRYYGNPTLAGDPMLVRDDADINFDWSSRTPATGMPTGSYSVRWIRFMNFAPGYYRLNVHASGGVRVYVAGQRVMDHWEPQDDARYSRDGVLLRGTQELQVEYTKGATSGRIRFWIEPTGPSGPPPPGDPPVACVSGPLELEAWPLGVVPEVGGFIATVYAGARGGDCLYTYAWEGRVVGGPMHGSLSFDLSTTTLTAMVGKLTVTSGGQTVGRYLYILPPED